jgi:thiosulfate dehydrogenase (quinone) large subunit
MLRAKQIIFGLLRISLGLIFTWAFVDKLLGLGFTTCRDSESGVVSAFCEKAWINGGSPTTGFLKFATQGPFAEVFSAVAGSAVVDWLFMLGLLGIGASLLLGILTRIAVWSGMVLMILMYLAVLPPEHHPFIDEHVVYGLLLLSFLFIPVGEWLGFGRAWARVTNNNPWSR